MLVHVEDFDVNMSRIYAWGYNWSFQDKCNEVWFER